MSHFRHFCLWIDCIEVVITVGLAIRRFYMKDETYDFGGVEALGLLFLHCKQINKDSS